MKQVNPTINLLLGENGWFRTFPEDSEKWNAVSSMIWTRVGHYISSEDNRYTKRVIYAFNQLFRHWLGETQGQFLREVQLGCVIWLIHCDSSITEFWFASWSLIWPTWKLVKSSQRYKWPMEVDWIPRQKTLDAG